MAAPTCTLRTRRPTPTTASFVVSTASPINSITDKVLYFTGLILRINLACYILLILAVKWDTNLEWSIRYRLFTTFTQSPPGWVALLIARSSPALYLVPVSAACLWLLLQRGYTEESLVVLRGLGIQTTTSASIYFSPATTRFIPTSAIQDIFIHEAFKGFEVRFYLAIVVEAEEDVVVIFPNLLPGRNILEEVWRGARQCLYEPKS